MPYYLFLPQLEHEGAFQQAEPCFEQGSTYSKRRKLLDISRPYAACDTLNQHQSKTDSRVTFSLQRYHNSHEEQQRNLDDRKREDIADYVA